jgi:hypothetical protein
MIRDRSRHFLSLLQRGVVVLGTVELVRARGDRGAVLEISLVLVQPRLWWVQTEGPVEGSPACPIKGARSTLAC